MPKLRQPLSEVKNQELLAIVAMRKQLLGYTNADLARSLRCHENTVINRLHEPDKWPLGDLRRLCDVLHFSDEERNSILSNKKYL